jgi:predicted metal-dependent hydrolase
MKTVLILAASILTLTVLASSDAEAQRRGVRAGGYGAVGARGVVVASPRYRGGYYRRGYRPGLGVAAGLGVGALAVGAAAAGASYYGSNPCLQQQQYWTGYAYQSQWVRVC